MYALGNTGQSLIEFIIELGEIVAAIPRKWSHVIAKGATFR